ncbi:Citrate lyase subunit beta [Pigmentiphaga humi]|uniref:Citrate lyase subunit beta n=1 Tax=Pigmentiphaga humi TaxID=2478468 RepID=A0A3P4AZT9_9BURK|nr:CoA ester lyase [Pigmentiphaga humi]VCU69292.1 Citrate lyase subunit beta [Pigmentiphaga humi]
MIQPLLPPTFLFCPGNRPDRYDKALRGGAPGVIIDLEDAVPVQDKDSARRDTLSWLAALDPAAPGQPVVALRISPPQTAAGLEDLYALAHAGPLPALDLVVLPKAESAAEVRLAHAHARAAREAVRVMALIESVRGVRQAADIAQAGACLAGLAFGAVDYAVDAGADIGWEALAYVRGRLLFETSGVPLLDVPHVQIDDDAGLRVDCERARAMGFHGKLAIHPRQWPIIVQAFAPSAQRLAWAREVVAAYVAAGGRACSVGGAMVDEPVYLGACRILRQAVPS